MKRIALAIVTIAALLPLAGSASAAALSHGPMIRVGRPGAGPDTNTQSTNWSGYAAYKTGTTFTDVKGSWVEPSVSCPSRQHQYAAFWVGIDGYTSNSVEQIGTDSDCAAKNRPSYYAWYEMYPKSPVNLSLTIKPGDTISGEVSFSGGSSFTLTLTDQTTGKSFTTTQSYSGAALSSAEWIAEAPSSFSVLPLADFGTVNFTGSYTTGNGHTGSISDSSWSNDQITMVNNKGTVKAQPSGLTSSGTAFSVTWHHK